ncbi:Trans-cinnamate 4-monooxygenase [Nymphaea thermarum]|nr:Trans-cinnamate 4-monooxygenase [Nymphaea thermarum]
MARSRSEERKSQNFFHSLSQASPRTCLGKDFAYRQMKIAAALLTAFFRFKLKDPSKEVTYKTMVTLHIDQGLHVRALHRHLIFIGKSLGSKAYPPVKGTMFYLLRCLDSLYDYQTEIVSHNKTVRYLFFSHSELLTADPQNIEYILKTNFANYDKGPRHQEITKDLLGDGIFAVDGQKWRHQRKVASYEFSTKVLRDFSSVVFRRNAAVLARKISENAEADLPMDMHNKYYVWCVIAFMYVSLCPMQELFTKYSMDSIFEVGFGLKLNILDGSNEEAITFANAFDESNALTYHRYVNLFWKVKRFINVGTEATLRKNIAVIDEFIYKIISSRRKQYSCHQSSHVKEDILSRFLLESEKTPETMNDRYLRDIILNFMIAGKDTTGGTLSWFIYLLCKHPLIQEKIAHEVKEIVGSCEKGQFTQFVERLTEGALENLQYLHAALSETLRLYPAVPLDRQSACKDDILPDGFKVKKGDGVNHVTYAMGRMKYIWGDDAEDFRPERWLHDGVFRPQSPFKFPAFHMAIVFYICCGAASLLVLFACLCVLRIVTGKSLGSKAYPPVKGTMFHLLRCLDRLYDYQAEVAAHNKTVRYLFFSHSEVYTADPQNIEYILKTNFANYDKVTNKGHLLSSALFLVVLTCWLFEAKLLSREGDSMSNQWWTMKCFNSLLLQGEYHQETTKDLLGDGIFAVDGQKWRHQRKVSSYEFSTKNLRDFSSVVFRRSGAVLAQKISDNAEADLPMDMHELFTKYSMEAIFEVGFGVKLNILDGSNEEAITFAKAFDESNALTFHRYVDLFWKVKRFFNVGTEAKLRTNIAVIDEFIYKIISSRRKQYSCHQSSYVTINLLDPFVWKQIIDMICWVKEDILSRFLLESEKNPETMNDRYLRDIILNFMIAGKDTTGGTLSWFIYLLCKHPLIQEKIAQEVKEIVGSCEKGQFVKKLSEGALEKLQYLHAALSETLRLYPAVPIDRQCACKDDILPDGFKVKKGDGVNHVT